MPVARVAHRVLECGPGVTVLSILIAEDDPIQRKLISAFLRQQGHQVDEAGDAYSAIELIDNHKFDLVVADWQMPGNDGLSVLKHARRASPKCAIVLMSGLIAAKKELLRTREARFISKPFHLEDLLRIVHQLKSLG